MAGGFTQVSGQILDPSGNVYANSRIFASFLGQNTTPGAGPYLLGGLPSGQFETIVVEQADSFGNFNMLLADNNVVLPSPSQWSFTVVAQDGKTAFGVLVTITGATQTITSQLQAAAAPLFGGIALTISSLNGRILVDGIKYPKTAAGIQAAINDAQANGAREVWLPSGTININTTLTITHGGFRIIGSGSGFNDSASTPSTLLQWTGSAEQDLLQITGTALNRLDRVVLENMILDGGGTARYVIRAEKIDDAELHGVRLRQGATACFYTVDATGWKFIGVQFSQLPSFGLVCDWGTGGFDWTGGNVDVLVANSNPAILIQGNTNSWHARGLELDASGSGAFAGFIQVTGFDANSSFASAPAGGSGSPSMVTFSDMATFMHVGSNAPSQGAGILVTGTAANPSIKVALQRCQFNGLSISPSAIKVDFSNNFMLYDSQSSEHTTSTLVHTGNGSFVGMQYLVSTDPARVSGAGAGLQMDITQSTAGQFANVSSISGSILFCGRVRASQGTALVAGDIALSAGWGASAGVSVVVGKDQAFTLVILAQGAGQAANPTVTLTYHNGSWTAAPVAVVLRNDLNSPIANPPQTWTTSATQLIITFNGTPVAGTSYTFTVVHMGI